MALKTHVFISSVNNLSDARYCAGMHVDFIGFSFEPTSQNYISREKFKELTEWLSGVNFVGEFESHNVQDIRMSLHEYGTDFVQVRDKDIVSQLQYDGFKVFLLMDINDWVNLGDVRPNYLVVEGIHKELLKEEINIISKLSQDHKTFIGYGIDESNVDQVLADTQAHGIALQGGDEIKPGYKDYDELADILEKLEIDDLA